MVSGFLLSIFISLLRTKTMKKSQIDLTIMFNRVRNATEFNKQNPLFQGVKQVIHRIYSKKRKLGFGLFAGKIPYLNV